MVSWSELKTALGLKKTPSEDNTFAVAVNGDYSNYNMVSAGCTTWGIIANTNANTLMRINLQVLVIE